MSAGVGETSSLGKDEEVISGFFLGGRDSNGSSFLYELPFLAAREREGCFSLLLLCADEETGSMDGRREGERASLASKTRAVATLQSRALS